ESIPGRGKWKYGVSTWLFVCVQGIFNPQDLKAHFIFHFFFFFVQIIPPRRHLLNLPRTQDKNPIEEFTISQIKTGQYLISISGSQGEVFCFVLFCFCFFGFFFF
uniref:Uncharacterized protein n=1 Tax=Mustela putorius furo TaxID=9669 RepID=M3XNU1_MUSPF